MNKKNVYTKSEFAQKKLEESSKPITVKGTPEKITTKESYKMPSGEKFNKNVKARQAMNKLKKLSDSEKIAELSRIKSKTGDSEAVKKIAKKLLSDKKASNILRSGGSKLKAIGKGIPKIGGALAALASGDLLAATPVGASTSGGDPEGSPGNLFETGKISKEQFMKIRERLKQKRKKQ